MKKLTKIKIKTETNQTHENTIPASIFKLSSLHPFYELES